MHLAQEEPHTYPTYVRAVEIQASTKAEVGSPLRFAVQRACVPRPDHGGPFGRAACRNPSITSARLWGKRCTVPFLAWPGGRIHEDIAIEGTSTALIIDTLESLPQPSAILGDRGEGSRISWRDLENRDTLGIEGSKSVRWIAAIDLTVVTGATVIGCQHWIRDTYGVLGYAYVFSDVSAIEYSGVLPRVLIVPGSLAACGFRDASCGASARSNCDRRPVVPAYVPATWPRVNLPRRLTTRAPTPIGRLDGRVIYAVMDVFVRWAEPVTGPMPGPLCGPLITAARPLDWNPREEEASN
ncbi:hypothetical protein KM043_004541 [Ampulex compressa]|nr:hypothetical protein KM043_004541 [Ampulex compressa]